MDDYYFAQSKYYLRNMQNVVKLACINLEHKKKMLQKIKQLQHNSISSYCLIKDCK